jgi:hypothetical protein
MQWTLAHLPSFTVPWRSERLSDEDLQALEAAIMRDPSGAPVMKGTGGLRKIRFAPSARGKGKSGSMRVGYAQFPERRLILLITLFSKSSQENLGAAERNQIKALLGRIEDKIKRGEPI